MKAAYDDGRQLKRSEMMASLSREGQCGSGSRDVDAADAEGARSFAGTHFRRLIKDCLL